MNRGYEQVRFGTSSWAYEGWQGLVYHRPYAKTRFSQDTLAEYASHTVNGAPLFRTVGIDHSFYCPAGERQLAHYAAQVPDDFHFCQKVWEDITIPVYAKIPRYGAKAGMANPRFLDVHAFQDLVLVPAQKGLGSKLGPFVFEFQRTGAEPATFLDALDRFLAALPSGAPYAVEVRNPALLGRRYYEVLASHGVSHVYNHWTFMPPLSEQHRLMGGSFTAPRVLFRLLTPLGLAYEQAVERYKPYDRIVQAQLQMRQETVSLIRQAAGEGRAAYVLVNNRCEGCSPLTVQALAAQLRDGPRPPRDVDPSGC